MKIARALPWLLALAPACFAGCGSDETHDDGGAGSGARPENTGAACEAPSDCYPNVADRSALAGEITCLDRVEDGYCTHQCETDDDCCAVSGECKAGLRQVCSPFESTGLRMCFLSCEAADLVDPDGGPDVDENEYCQREANPAFICRSSGGGAANRKVCVPGDCDVGEACSGDAECAEGLRCITSFQGGYCTTEGCSTSDDCPNDSACVERSGRTYCLKRCAVESDCGACRPWQLRGACTADVALVEGGSASVCLPP